LWLGKWFLDDEDRSLPFMVMGSVGFVHLCTEALYQAVDDQRADTTILGQRLLDGFLLAACSCSESDEARKPPGKLVPRLSVRFGVQTCGL
jgi:hypothetical protein